MIRYGLFLISILTLECTALKPASFNSETAIQILKKAAKCSDFWVKVHAIEYFTELGFREEAQALIQSGLTIFQNEPQKRIGYWRAEYRNTQDSITKQSRLNQIKLAYIDSTSPDRMHAAETLAKLSYSLQHFASNQPQKDLADGSILSDFVRWGLAIPKESYEPIAWNSLLDALQSPSLSSRKLAAYSLSFIGQMPNQHWPILARAALHENKQSEAAAYLLGTAYVLAPTYQTRSRTTIVNQIKHRLLDLQHSKRKSDHIELCRALAQKGNSNDVTLLLRYMKFGTLPYTDLKQNPLDELDIQAAAAYALLRIEKRIH